MKYCVIITWPFNHKRFPERIIPIENCDNWKISTPFLEREKSRYNIVPSRRYKMPFWYLIRVLKHNCMQRDFFVIISGTMSNRTFSNYNEVCKENHLLSMFFSIKRYCHPTKSFMFLDTIFYWQYIIISLRMRRLYLSLFNVGHVCITKRPSSLENVGLFKVWKGTCLLQNLTESDIWTL